MALISPDADNQSPLSAAAEARPPGGWPTPQSAYIHVPFCRHRCGYCNFSVVANRDDLIERFLAAMDRELDSLDRPHLQTLFIGGGTPTHLSADQLDRLLSLVSNRFILASDIEWSIEANPEDISDELLNVLAAHGVNRISLGVQSFDDEKLKHLERGHSGHQAMNAIDAAAAHIENVSIDLIFAAPGEQLDGWCRDLHSAVKMPLQHVSTYALTVEKGTTFWNRHNRGDLDRAGESLEVEMYQTAMQICDEAGLKHYEVSNFARDGARCRHNLAYWDGRGWYAAGPGAARFVDGRREVNHRSPTTYLRRVESAGNPTAESEAITVDQYARERAAFGIRLMQGIDLQTLRIETGVDLGQVCRDAIDRSQRDGLLEVGGSQLRLTERGILFADTVASRFLG